jgi:hypothetical protein
MILIEIIIDFDRNKLILIKCNKWGDFNYFNKVD